MAYIPGNNNPNILTGGVEDDYLDGFGGNDTLLGNGGNDTLRGGLGADSLNGGVGFDTATYDSAASGVVVNLADASQNLGDAAGDTYNSVENVVGTFYNDTLTGDNGNNSIFGFDNSDSLFGSGGNDFLFGGAGTDFLSGGSGGDYLDGGDGFDFISYSFATSGVIADFLNSNTNTGEALGDSYVSVDGLIGSDFNDVLSGDAAANSLYGGKGADALGGNGGNDFLSAGEGDDALYGGAGADYLGGDDGFDLAVYANATSGIVVDLVANNTNTGDAAGDAFFSIEGVIATQFGDAISGDSGNNYLDGLDGADIIAGNGGNDTVVGGGGNDVLRGGIGADNIVGGAGIDVADYALSASGVTASLEASFSNTGEAAGDNYSSVEWLFGSSFADFLVGDGGDNLLVGGDGNDTMVGRGGTDIFIGGAGSDVYGFRQGDGIDYVNGFTHGEDKLTFSTSIFNSAEAAFAATIEDPGSRTAYVNCGNGNLVILNGVQLSQLTASDFLVF
ncbi:calcium-binding protein [Methylobacterium sp. Leaf399]|uniref:calcium-binding protein n=1 Tax=Methylobacterium sp. Leaf399 TaxID=1736364 RepID=UPI000AB0C646|nr:calcium-binding protein [Methylobacterium sp. Leaf399]